MENHTQIFRILNKYYTRNKLTVIKNKKLSPAITDVAKVMINKSVFASWSSAIPEVALQQEVAFAAYRICILLIGKEGDYWNGSGQFLPEMYSDGIYSYCGTADLAFSIELDEFLLRELTPYLEDPAQAKAQKNMESQAMLEELRKIRDRYSGI